MSGKKLLALSSCFLCLILPLLLPACVGAANANSGRWPDWVRDPYAKYNRQAYVAAVGGGSSRETAEKSALGNLVAVFGQRITVDESVSVSYRQAVRNGDIAKWSENTGFESLITTSAGIDSLIGAEIGEIWNDGSEYYAVAVLNKAKAIQTYSSIIGANEAAIANLIDLTIDEKNSFEGYARYGFAAMIADMMAPYVNLLSFIGGVAPSGLKSGGEYRLEAFNIKSAIPIGLRVRNDNSKRIESAFAKALSDSGFHAGSSRYVLDVDIAASEVEIANNIFKWTRIVVSANLIDTFSGTSILPYSFNEREGHTSQAEADNRAYMAAERRINEEYAKLFDEYLSGLTPKGRN